VYINGTEVLSNFDIYAAAGGKNIAIDRIFQTTPDASGAISIQYVTERDNAKSSGIAIYAAPSILTPEPSSLVLFAFIGVGGIGLLSHRSFRRNSGYRTEIV
jgi:hypothetical protein